MFLLHSHFYRDGNSLNVGMEREAKPNREDCIFISARIGTGNVQASRMKVSLKKFCLIIVLYTLREITKTFNNAGKRSITAIYSFDEL